MIKKLRLKKTGSQKIRWTYSLPFFQVIVLANYFIDYLQIKIFKPQILLRIQTFGKYHARTCILVYIIEIADP